MKPQISKYFGLTAKLLLILLFAETPTAFAGGKCSLENQGPCTFAEKYAFENLKNGATPSTDSKPEATEATPPTNPTPAAPVDKSIDFSKLNDNEKEGLQLTQREITKQYENYDEKSVSLLKNLTVPTANPKITPLQNTAKSDVAQMKALGPKIKSCNESALETARNCLESMDPGVQSSMSALGQLAPSVGMMSMADTCSTFSKLMTGLNTAMGVFRANCAREKLSTENTCEPILKEVATIRASAKKTKDKADTLRTTLRGATVANPTAAGDLQILTDVVNVENQVEEYMKVEADPGTLYTPAYGMKVADGKGVVLANAGANALQVAGTAMSGQKCNVAATADPNQDICTKYPNLCAGQTPIATADYCVTNPNDITCICSKNVNDPACTGTKAIDPSTGSNTVLNPSDPNFSLDGTSDTLPNFNPVGANGLVDGGDGTHSFGGADGGPPGSADGASGGNPNSSGNKGGASNLGSFGGGSDGRGNGGRSGGIGGLGSGGSGGGSGGSGPGGGYGGTGFNTDISHEGGAGAGLGMGGDGTRKPSTEDLLKAFLPGGDKDPKKAGKGALDGITGAAGLTIFQKVTRGYQRHTSSLIPE